MICIGKRLDFLLSYCLAPFPPLLSAGVRSRHREKEELVGGIDGGRTGCDSWGGGGLEPKKTTLKKCGPLPMSYS